MSPALNGSSAIQRFEGSDAIEIRDGITFDSYTGLPHTYFYHIEQQIRMMYVRTKIAHTKQCQSNIIMVYPWLCLVNHQAEYICVYTPCIVGYTYTYIIMCGIYLQICESLPGHKIYASLH